MPTPAKTHCANTRNFVSSPLPTSDHQRIHIDRNQDGTRDWRELTVQRDKVIQVSDSNADGRADALRTIQEYHSEVTGIVA